MSFGGNNKKLSGVASQVAAPAAAPAEPAAPDAEKLRRMGRASILLSTTSQGVLGAPNTGRRQLLSAQ